MNLSVPKGATKQRKRLGRGTSSGLGKTAGRGTKGQKARNTTRPGFEGGQMPLYRRIARRGFSNVPFKKNVLFVHLADLSRCFNKGDVVSLATLKEKRLVKKVAEYAKILSDGEIDKVLTIEKLSMSKVAREKLLAAKCTIIEAEEVAAPVTKKTKKTEVTEKVEQAEVSETPEMSEPSDEEKQD